MPFKNLKEAASFSAEKMKKNKVFETSRLNCDLYCFEPGQEQKVHSHDDQDKIYLVIEGTGTFKVGSEEKILSKDMVILAEGGVDHGVKNNGTGPLTLFVLVAPAGHHAPHAQGHGHHH
ncbi:MAG: cupin domain-containing protein [Nitrospirae bacterium]|nr:cupin domain-containing protein [Nitrospirota bacterium]MBI3595436.1 cupin domain-containing protein [Nitrospirota bacterium]